MTNKTYVIRTYFMVLLLLVQSSCTSASSPGSQALAKFQGLFAKEISQEYDLRIEGVGASFPVKIKSIIFSFQSNHCSNIATARKLAVEIAHKMIAQMNEDVDLLKYLSSNPASLEHVDLIIGFKDPDNGKTPGALDSVMVIGMRNKVVFNTYNEAKTMLVPLHKETFDEAERIVQQFSKPI